MKFTKIKIIILALCVIFLFSGCSVVEVTDKNKSSATISENNESNLFEGWSPLVFTGGQTMNYNFMLKTDEYSLSGNFTLSVSGTSKSNLKFNWRFIIGNETKKGSFSGNSSDFTVKFKESCYNGSVEAMVYQALFAPYEEYGLFSEFQSSDKMPDIGAEWTSQSGNKTIEHNIESIITYGQIDGYNVMSSVDGMLSQVVGVSPFIPMPTMTLFFIGADSESYILCELSGAILP